MRLEYNFWPLVKLCTAVQLTGSRLVRCSQISHLQCVLIARIHQLCDFVGEQEYGTIRCQLAWCPNHAEHEL